MQLIAHRCNPDPIALVPENHLLLFISCADTEVCLKLHERTVPSPNTKNYPHPAFCLFNSEIPLNRQIDVRDGNLRRFKRGLAAISGFRRDCSEQRTGRTWVFAENRVVRGFSPDCDGNSLHVRFATLFFSIIHVVSLTHTLTHEWIASTHHHPSDWCIGVTCSYLR
jgi:hypothetical protein